MILRDISIENRCTTSVDPLISPYDPSLLNPASYDVRLSTSFHNLNTRPGTVSASNGYEELELWYNTEYDLAYLDMKPGDCWLGSTLETVNVPTDLCARFEGKSSLGRIFLLTHMTAGFIDPGFHGQITVELFNASCETIRLYAGQRIGQLCFMLLDGVVRTPYGHEDLGSHYQGQIGATPSWLGA